MLQGHRLTDVSKCLFEWSSMATLSTLTSLPVSIPLGAVSLARASFNGVAMLLTKKYLKKIVKATKLTNIVTSALAMFEMSISKALSDGKVNEQEFNMLQTLHLEGLNDLSNVVHKMEAKTRTQLQKILLEEINYLKKAVRGAS